MHTLRYDIQQQFPGGRAHQFPLLWFQCVALSGVFGLVASSFLSSLLPYDLKLFKEVRVKKILTARMYHRYALKKNTADLVFNWKKKHKKTTNRSDWPCGKVNQQPQAYTAIFPSLKTLCKNRRSLIGQKCCFIKKQGTRNSRGTGAKVNC